MNTPQPVQLRKSRWNKFQLTSIWKWATKWVLKPTWFCVKWMPGLLLLLVLCMIYLTVNIEVKVNDEKTKMYRVALILSLFTNATVAAPPVPTVPANNSTELELLADKAANKYGIDTKLFRALVKQESNWNPLAVSSVGAAGLTQLMPDTAQAECNLTAKERFEVEKSLDCGAKYLSAQLRRFGSVDLALAAYNAGPAKVASLGRIPRNKETPNYVRRIMDDWASTFQSDSNL